MGPDQLHGLRRRLTTDIYPSDFSWVKTRTVGGFQKKYHARGYRLPNVGVRPWSMGLTYDEETHSRALEYIHSRDEGHVPRCEYADSPFFLCVSYHHPHEPFHVTQAFWDLYEGQTIETPEYPSNLEETRSVMDRWLNTYHGADEIDVRQPESLYALRRSYYGSVSYIDHKVGGLLVALEEAGLADSTIVIFASDHGDMLCEKCMVQKRTFYEWSARVPLIFRFPDGWKAGTTCATPVSLVDLAPTVLEMAGVTDWLPLDGVSLIGLLEGSDLGERPVFSEMHVEGVDTTCFMVRRRRHKYVYIHGEDAQLFDLERDPEEWRNLVGAPGREDIERELRECILRRFDPDGIEAQLRESLLNRQLINRVMQVNDTHWDHDPGLDVARQYARR